MTATTHGPDHRPVDVALLVDFTNTLDVTEGTDELTTPAALGHWLETRRLLPAGGAAATPTDLRTALELRAALHAAFEAHHDGREDGARLARVADDLPLRVDVLPDGPRLEPLAAGVPGALAVVVAAVARTAADGTWRRIKICSAGDCFWAYYDATKNRSRTWCEWGCGNKIKTRNYRARRKLSTQ